MPRAEGGRAASAFARVRVREGGRMTLPADFQAALGIGAGSVLVLERRAPGRFEVRVLARRWLLDFTQVDAEGFAMDAVRAEIERYGG